MGKRKSTLKKQTPKRNDIYKSIRKTWSENLVEFMDKRGNSVYLNLPKHFFFQKIYKNHNYNMELIRVTKKFIENIHKKEEKIETNE